MSAYRPEIDGLRAVAVMAVIFFHLDISLFKGGFAGVDIFFVISGFLITSIIHQQLQAGTFSLAEFYERRARRILPALSAVCAAVLIGAATIMYTDDTIEVSKSVLATMLFVSNIFFWTGTGYFSAEMEQVPLLHTWSLGVEEQFYIIVPLLLMALFKFCSDKVWKVMAILTAASLVLGEIAVRNWPDAGFYLLPFRFWELGVGALLALKAPAMPQIRNAANWLGGAGMVLVLWSILSLSDKGFPGISALAPCVGAALIIYAGMQSSWVQKVLSQRHCVIVGRMSYSLYLWHWPVLAFAHYRFESPDRWIGTLIILVATLVLSYLSWRFIETPFRNRAFMTRNHIFAASAVAMIALILASASLLHAKGLPGRFGPEIAHVKAASHDQAAFVMERCLQDEDQVIDEACYVGFKDAHAVKAVIWGDSHASAFVPALENVLSSRSLKAVMQTKYACSPLLGDAEWKSRNFEECRDFNQRIYEWIKTDQNIKYVFLSARWQSTAEKFAEDEREAREKFSEALTQTVTLLTSAGKQVFLIAPVPEPGFDVPRCLARQLQFGERSFTCPRIQLLDWMTENALSLSAFNALESQVPVFFPSRVLCPGESCNLTGATGILYFDDDHLSKTGAQSLSVGVEATFGPRLPYD